MVKKNYKDSRQDFLIKPWMLFLPSLVLAGMSDVQAMRLDIKQHWVKDYLDFAQNKGIFERGATGLELVRKDGTVIAMPNVPFPDFSVVTNHGSSTSIGGAYMVTATHNKKYGPWHFSVQNPAFGKTTYSAIGDAHVSPDVSGGDFSVIRLNKFVVETTGVKNGIDTSLNWDQFVERYGVEFNGKRTVVAYRAGAGVLNIVDNGGLTEYKDVSYKPELLGGGFFDLYDHGKGTEWIHFKNFTSFNNSLTTGDSGSGVLIWDNFNQEWVIAGALNGVLYGGPAGEWFRYGKWNQTFVDNFKEKYTHSVALNKGNLVFDSTDKNQYTINNGIAETFANNKDLSFTGGGEITLSQNLHLGNFGLIFDENSEYTVNGLTYSYKGAGIDIGKNTIVHWNVLGDSSDNLHKIGEGTLEVNVAQGNNLKVGNGTVLLNAQKSFNNIYLANGYATVKLGREDALNTADGRNGIYFARMGGVLDLNGFSQRFNRIAASDEGAIITNTSNQIADVSITLPNATYAYHGQFQGNLNITHNFADETDSYTKHKNRHLILDGGMDIKGDVSVTNAKLTMQGLPVTHSYFGANRCQAPQFLFPCSKDVAQEFKKKEQAINDSLGTHYKTVNQINTFDQPDWKTRTYRFNRLALDKAVFGLGRNTELYTNIDAHESTIQFGGDVSIYRDNHAGDNVTGFDFRQDLKDGKSDQNDTIYFEGEIKASKSEIISHLPLMAASFDLKEGSSFVAADKSGLTRILDKGIKVEGGSSLELGNVVVQNTNQGVSISKSSDSKIVIEDVEVKKASLHLPGEVVNGVLKAYEDGYIYVDKWTLANSNLQTFNNGKIYLETLESSGQQVADANITISEHLALSDLNPNEAGLNSQEWIGLSINNTLTLEQDSKISATLSNDYLSIKNIRFNSEHTLVKALTLNDQRKDKEIVFTMQGNEVEVTSGIKDNTIVFSFGSNPDQDNEDGQGSGGNGSGSIYEILDTPVGNAFLEQFGGGKEQDLLLSILEHNVHGGLTYQEVAIKDALSMSDTQAGVEALNKIVNRTNDMLDHTAKNIKKESLIRPIRNVLDSRLAVLRRSARSSVATYMPVASLNYDNSKAKKNAEQFINQSIYADVSVGYEQDGDLKENVVSTNLGYDNVLRLEKGRLVLGGAFSVSKFTRKEHSSKDEALMYSLTGYLSFEQKEGFELQSYLTAGYLNNDRSFMPEISLGQQKFDEDSWLLMSSNYFKYHFVKGPISIRPMLLADLGFTHTSSSESEYLKRDDLDDTSLDLGVGLELEGMSDSMGYLLQFTARKNVWSSNDAVGINLKNAQGFISYGLDKDDDVRFSGNLMISKRLKHDITLDIGAGMSANTGGGVGVNANARLRWLF